MRSDAELVEAVRAGDRGRFGELVRRYERAVRAVAVDILGDHHAAQDVAQESFVAAYERLGGLRDGAAFGAWMLAIARNRALTASKGRRRRAASELPHELPAHEGNGQLDVRAEHLLAAVIELPEHERLAVMLRYFDGHSVRAIAEITGCPTGTVTGRLSRARDRLREQLKECEP